jgi:hypothetical protein
VLSAVAIISKGAKGADEGSKSLISSFKDSKDVFLLYGCPLNEILRGKADIVMSFFGTRKFLLTFLFHDGA